MFAVFVAVATFATLANMPVATEISRPEQLPPLGAFERETLDFKRAQGAARGAFEYAKDVAALANHLGGTILVGAVEDRATATLVRYEPMDTAAARAVRTEYEQAVRNLCSPVPEVVVETIAHDTGFVVAVNVRAHVEKLVGVHRPGDGDAWTFPLRRATQTIYLLPEQLPLYAEPRVRRALLLLGRIAVGENVVLRVVREGSGGNHLGNTGSATLVKIDEDANTVVFGPGAGEPRYPLTNAASFALDSVRTVFREPNDTTWRVVIEVI